MTDRMRRQLGALRHRVGRRGLFLAFLAVLDVIYGYFILNPPAKIPAQPYPIIPGTAWAALWLATAAACTAGALVRRDRIAYAMAALVKTAWGLRYAYLWYLGTFPYAWVSMAVWLAFAGTVVVIASWPEEDITLPPGKRA